MADFIHLHTHSDYSLLDGAASIDSLTEKACQMGMNALALTDHGNMFGALKFYKSCREKGIAPIIGSEFYVAPDSRFKKTGGDSEDRYYHLILLSGGETGYKNLIQLSSLSYTEGFYYKPRIDKELLERYSDNLICLSACLAGEVPSLILRGREDEAEKTALYFRELFGNEGFYLEMHDHGIAEQKTVNRSLVEISKKTGIPLVATNDIHYPNREDARAQDILICIGTNKKINDGKRIKFQYPEFYFKSSGEMSQLFGETPEALNNTLKIAEMCRLEIAFSKPMFPEYKVPESYTFDSYLRKISGEGLEKRYSKITEQTKERLEYELTIICSMGFASYFLIVWDFIQFARENSIPVGPGRGSGAGSLVAYALQITDIDPLKYGLLFERLLNPERVEPPDLDIDFCFERRGEVIDYVTQKYGKEKVGQIITFGTMKARAAIRDVARVLDFPYAEADKIAKMIPEGPKVTLENALQSDSDLARIAQENERYKDLFDVSCRLEGLSRHTSTHAAGIVIGRTDLTDYVPLYRDAKTGAISTQFSMEYLVECGLVKMDFLGLKTLTIIEKTVQMIRKRESNFDIKKIPENDSAAFTLLGGGKSTCVFQFESSGMQGILKRSKPNSIADLSDLSALYRPGPIENIDQYIEAKTGKIPIRYPLPELEPILKETYGVIIYQEQVMEIARVIGGYTLGQADILRSAMGKKKPEVMAKEKARFLKGAQEKGYQRGIATKIFDLLIPFAGYGFNKSHSAAYALVAYQTAFLKANYPAAFMAANLTTEINNTDKLTQYITEARSMGLEVLPPDINLSGTEFTVADGVIVYGLCGIKNVGSGAALNIVEERKTNGPYTEMINFLERVDSKTANRKVVEALVLSGVMDKFGDNRATLFHNLDRLIEIGNQRKAGIAFGQSFLFDSKQIESFTHVEMEKLDEWPRTELLKLEKQNLGFFFSGHPLDDYRELLKEHRNLILNDTENASVNCTYTVIGFIKNIKEHLTRKGGKMAFAVLEDDLGSIECVIFTKAYEKFRELLQEDSILVLKGRLDKSRGDAKLLVDEILTPETLPDKECRSVHIRFQMNKMEESILYKLRDYMYDKKGKCELYLHLADPESSGERIIRAGAALTISSNRQVLEMVQQYPNVVEVWKE
jgi:DNA polymerase-3 subunit alpha